jgi:hypothetical protein
VILGLPTRVFVAGQLWGITTLCLLEVWDNGFSISQHSWLVWLVLLSAFAIAGYLWARGMMWFSNRASKKASEKDK